MGFQVFAEGVLILVVCSREILDTPKLVVPGVTRAGGVQVVLPGELSFLGPLLFTGSAFPVMIGVLEQMPSRLPGLAVITHISGHKGTVRITGLTEISNVPPQLWIVINLAGHVLMLVVFTVACAVQVDNSCMGLDKAAWQIIQVSSLDPYAELL